MMGRAVEISAAQPRLDRIPASLPN